MQPMPELPPHNGFSLKMKPITAQKHSTTQQQSTRRFALKASSACKPQWKNFRNWLSRLAMLIS
ncbi:hypothetical protein SAMN05518854_11440 [Variovorax sp. YR266]|nr:hypothetical protein SAMN05518854_11440 [Variovorax sp. YR266]